MALIRRKIGELISEFVQRNIECKDLPFIGININKEFMPSHADTNEIDCSKYKVVSKNDFVFSGMQTGRDNCIRIGMYDKKDKILVSPAYQTFRVVSDEILPRFLFMYFNSKEKDRYGAFLSDGSIRSNLDWDRFCDIEIDLPPIEIQRKYVTIYEGLLANLKVYESKLEDLKLVCDGYIEDLRKKYPLEELRNYIEENKDKNEKVDAHILGISKDGFIEPKQDVGKENNYTLFSHNDFVYSPPRINVGSIGLYKGNEKCACSPIYVAFHVKDLIKLNPDYLAMWYKRDEFLRHTDFYSIASVRNNFSFDLMQEYRIPFPPIEIQNSIVEVFNVYNKRKEYVTRLKNIIKDICPFLVRGALEESKA